jgi:hypothetical protein
MTRRIAELSGRHRAAVQGRTLHLVDLENLVGGRVSAERCSEAWSAYLAIVGIDRDDQVVVAVADEWALEALLQTPRPAQQLAPRREKDAADRALLDAWPIPDAARLFTRALIASGDNVFAEYAAALGAAGLTVEVVTGYGKCGAELYRTCSRHYDLSRWSMPGVAA